MISVKLLLKQYVAECIIYQQKLNSILPYYSYLLFLQYVVCTVLSHCVLYTVHLFTFCVTNDPEEISTNIFFKPFLSRTRKKKRKMDWKCKLINFHDKKPAICEVKKSKVTRSCGNSVAKYGLKFVFCIMCCFTCLNKATYKRGTLQTAKIYHFNQVQVQAKRR